MLPMSLLEEVVRQVGEPAFRRAVTRGVVSLGYTAREPGSVRRKYDQASGFLISVEGTWFLITAGHVLTGFKDLKGRGLTVGGWHLDDSPGRGQRVPPFTFDDEDTLVIVKERKDDYAAIRIKPFHREQLEANGKVAMAEDQWRPGWGPDNPPDIKAICIVGVPSEHIRAQETPDGFTVDKGIAFCEVLPLGESDVPEEFRWEATSFYGRIAGKLVDEETGIEVQSIKGMSGGPVIVLSITEGGILACTPLAIQSTWFPKSRIVVGCPLRAFAEYLREGLLAR